MSTKRFVTAAALLVFSTAVESQPFQAASAEVALEIRFCPASVIRSYPLDSLRSVQSILIQNVAALNHADGDVDIQSIEIALLLGGEIQDMRHITGPSLTSVLRTGQAMQAQGVTELLPFQFCDGQLLGGARLAATPAIGPGGAALVTQQVFAYRGQRDEARVTIMATIGGRPIQAQRSIAIDAATSRTHFRWPLRGGPWLVGAASSFHTTHRWAIPEEFALDIFAVGANGRSYRTGGDRNGDFLAYDAEVVAAADGRVARLVTGAIESAPMLRRPGEALAAYYARLSERQAVFIAAGEPGFMGDAIIIDHGNGEHSIYAHLVPGSIRVAVGDQVRAGQPIGQLGSSGNSTEPHLHFQVCDRPSAVSCAGIIPTFEGLDLPLADGPRPLQSGDLVVATTAPAPATAH